MDTTAPYVTRQRQSVLERLRQEHFAPRELAEVLDIDVALIYQAAFHGALKARIVGHDVVDIERHDVITWLRDRD